MGTGTAILYGGNEEGGNSHSLSAVASATLTGPEILSLLPSHPAASSQL